MTAAVVWCRMNDCYRAVEVDSEFCRRHGWWQTKPEREPQARTPNGRPASSRAAAAEDTTSRSVQAVYDELQKRIRRVKTVGFA